MHTLVLVLHCKFAEEVKNLVNDNAKCNFLSAINFSECVDDADIIALCQGVGSLLRESVTEITRFRNRSAIFPHNALDYI